MNTMKTKTSTSKKIMRRKGFMCQSPASTAICMSTSDPRTVVIIPRKTAADHGSVIDQHSQLLNKNNLQHSSGSTNTTSSRRSRLPADSHRNHQHPRQKFNTSTSNLNSHGHDHYNKRFSSAFIRNRGEDTIPAPPPPLSTLPSNFQVVVMKVSLHCQGCAGKVKKHLSKMEGVTSFSIDLEMKRVTVMGHVSPVGVLESISKVKRAEFWTTATTC